MIEIATSALLFDLDGTLIDSLPAVERAWSRFAARHHLVPSEVLTKIHGRRSIDSIRALLPDVDPHAEDLVIRQFETEDTNGVRALPGAKAILESLPPECWAIVTSGTGDVARARCKAARLPEPSVFVCGDDVAHGKPSPEPFLLAASKLKKLPGECIGFEDTVAGMQSIKSAGMTGIGIGIPANYTIRDLSEISVTRNRQEFLVSLP